MTNTDLGAFNKQKVFDNLVANLSEVELKNLMYALCRSGKIVIPQFYYAKHIQNFWGAEPTTDDMIDIQDYFENDSSTHEFIDDAIIEICDNIKTERAIIDSVEE